MKFFLFLSLVFGLLPSLFAQQKTQVVLLGVYHLNNPGLDVAKVNVDDVLSEKRQAEIRQIVAALKAYGPEQIFTEFRADEQARVDSLYRVYLAGGRRDKRGETDQIVFRLGQELKLKPGQIFGVDSPTDFPYDSLVQVANGAGQQALLTELNQTIAEHTRWFNEYLSTHTIGETFLAVNSPEKHRSNLGSYSSLMSQAGGLDNSVGAYLTAEWYRRNIYAHSNILKRIAPGTKRILVVFGSGHAAVFEHLFRLSDRFEVVPVSQVLK